jgi:uncharacterized membrane protein
MKEIIKKQGTFIIYGLVFWLPVALVAYIGVLLFSNVENIGKTVLGIGMPDKYIYPGFGILLFVLVVYISGILLKTTKLGKILSKIPEI